MKSFVASLAVVCVLLASCLPPAPEVKHDTPSPSPDPPASVAAQPSPPPIDPWKVASEWPGPGGPLGDAQRFLLNVLAYQCTDEAEDLTTHQKSHGIVRVVHHEALLMETEEPRGKNGIYTNGKREFVFYQGRYGEEPGDAAAALVEQLQSASLQLLFDAGKGQISVLGPEKVDGVQAEKFAWDMQSGGNTSLTWNTEGGRVTVWVAKGDHRPLKTEWKGNQNDYNRSGVIHPWSGTRTYRYDPGVKVTPPGA